MNHLRVELRLNPTITSRREEIVADCTLVNEGIETLVINVIPLNSPSLCLEIIDSRSLPVLLPPPPVPKEFFRQAILIPMQRYSVEHAGFVPQWIPSGIYRIRLRYISTPSSPQPREWTGQAMSDWVEITILD